MTELGQRKGKSICTGNLETFSNRRYSKKIKSMDHGYWYNLNSMKSSIKKSTRQFTAKAKNTTA